MISGYKYEKCKVWFFLCCVVMTLGLSRGARAQVPPGYVDASTYGAGFNTTDATAALQGAIDTGSHVYVRNMCANWKVGPIHLSYDNQTIELQEGAVIEAKPGSFTGTSDALFSNTHDLSGGRIIGGAGSTLIMHKADYLTSPYTPSEYRHAIALGTVSNYTIAGLLIKDTGGDGIWIGGSSGTWSSNVTIQNVTIQDAYRNGIGIISCKGLLVDSVTVVSTNGTNPQAGIDIEPFLTNQEVTDITIQNSIFASNYAQGIVFNFADWIPNPQRAANCTATINHCTIENNHGEGIKMDRVCPYVTIKNCLDGDNWSTGFACINTTDGAATGYAQNSISNSAFYANGSGGTQNLSGYVGFGSNVTTTATPAWFSTLLGTYFLYLSSSSPATIKTGASDGTFKGARPVY